MNQCASVVNLVPEILAMTLLSNVTDSEVLAIRRCEFYIALCGSGGGDKILALESNTYSVALYFRRFEKVSNLVLRLALDGANSLGKML